MLWKFWPYESLCLAKPQEPVEDVVLSRPIWCPDQTLCPLYLCQTFSSCSGLLQSPLFSCQCSPDPPHLLWSSPGPFIGVWSLSVLSTYTVGPSRPLHLGSSILCSVNLVLPGSSIYHLKGVWTLTLKWSVTSTELFRYQMHSTSCSKGITRNSSL